MMLRRNSIQSNINNISILYNFKDMFLGYNVDKVDANSDFGKQNNSGSLSTKNSLTNNNNKC